MQTNSPVRRRENECEDQLEKQLKKEIGTNKKSTVSITRELDSIGRSLPAAEECGLIYQAATVVHTLTRYMIFRSPGGHAEPLMQGSMPLEVHNVPWPRSLSRSRAVFRLLSRTMTAGGIENSVSQLWSMELPGSRCWLLLLPLFMHILFDRVSIEHLFAFGLKGTMVIVGTVETMLTARRRKEPN